VIVKAVSDRVYNVFDKAIRLTFGSWAPVLSSVFNKDDRWRQAAPLLDAARAREGGEAEVVSEGVGLLRLGFN